MTELLFRASLIVLTLSCCCWPTAAQMTITVAGTFDAKCQSVTIKGTGAVTVYNPASLSFTLQGTSTAPNVLIAQNGSGAACATSSLSITAAEFTSMSPTVFETISFALGNTSRDIVVQTAQFLSGSGSKANLNLGSGSLRFSAATFSVVGSINVTFNGTADKTNTPRFTALNLAKGPSTNPPATIVVSSVGSTFIASIATLSFVNLSLGSVSSLLISGIASNWTYSTVTLRGAQGSSNATAQLSNSAFFVNISSGGSSPSFTMISSSLTVLREPRDTGSVQLFPNVVSMLARASTFTIFSAGSSLSQDIVFGGMSTVVTQQQVVNFVATTYGSVYLPPITFSGSGAVAVDIAFLSRKGSVSIAAYRGNSDFMSGISFNVNIQNDLLLPYTLQLTSIAARWVNFTGAPVLLSAASVTSSSLFSSGWPTSVVLLGPMRVTSFFSLSTIGASVTLGNWTTLGSGAAITLLSDGTSSAVPCSNSMIILSGSFGSSATITAYALTFMFDNSAVFAASPLFYFYGCWNADASVKGADFVVSSNAQFASPTFNINPLYLNTVTFQDGVIVSGPGMISIRPTATNAVSTVTLAGLSVLSSTLTVLATMPGAQDVIYVNANSASNGTFTGSTVVSVVGTQACGNAQRIVLRSPPTSVAASKFGRSLIHNMNITALYVGGGISASSATLSNVNVILTMPTPVTDCTVTLLSPQVTFAALQILDGVSLQILSYDLRTTTVSMSDIMISGTSMTIQGYMQNFALSNISNPLGPFQSSLVISSLTCVTFTIGGLIANISLSMPCVHTLVSSNVVLSNTVCLFPVFSSADCNMAMTALVNSSVSITWSVAATLRLSYRSLSTRRLPS